MPLTLNAASLKEVCNLHTACEQDAFLPHSPVELEELALGPDLTQPCSPPARPWSPGSLRPWHSVPGSRTPHLACFSILKFQAIFLERVSLNQVPVLGQHTRHPGLHGERFISAHSVICGPQHRGRAWRTVARERPPPRPHLPAAHLAPCSCACHREGARHPQSPPLVHQALGGISNLTPGSAVRMAGSLCFPGAWLLLWLRRMRFPKWCFLGPLQVSFSVLWD